MLRPQTYRLIAACSLLLTLGTLMPFPTHAQVAKARRSKVILQPRRDQGAPRVTLPGGRRDDGKCLEDRENEGTTKAKRSATDLLTPVVIQPANTVSLTATAHPTLLVYVPSTSATALEVTLEDSNKRGIDRVRVDLPQTPGIVRVPLTSFPALAVGQDYLWIASVVCDSGDPKDNFSSGIIRRIQLDSTMTSKLKQASPLDRAALYGQAGIWYEAAAILDELRRAQPNNSELQQTWKELLKSAGLEALSTTTAKN